MLPATTPELEPVLGPLEFWQGICGGGLFCKKPEEKSWSCTDWLVDSTRVSGEPGDCPLPLLDAWDGEAREGVVRVEGVEPEEVRDRAPSDGLL